MTTAARLIDEQAAVFAEAEVQPVTITRDGGEPLVLMSRREWEKQQRLAELATKFIGIGTAESHLIDQMVDTFPWMEALSIEARTACARDLVSAACASLSTGELHLADAELTSWRETANAIADGLVPGSSDWLGDGLSS
ncbi:MAG: type II toxin-antitoxin system Phd/YefM family antitoxin [Comamonadaceae bacterium]|nr:MAG: type II toxin-antitoxin system Phd/YefM family antitoxin [Comamonadaceae bacterium]